MSMNKYYKYSSGNDFSDELYHYGVPGMKWGKRKKVEYDGESGVSQRLNAARNTIKKGVNKVKKEIKKRSGGELSKRGKSAIDVLMNGDKDWMGNSISSNDISTEVRNRGRAALERLMYSQEQIDNKKFLGDYNPFD